ncbi:MAG: hypothetical protein Q7S92_05930 [Candidatus Diapherotrites archaeon]|nr:hypothetical protein [Candidatus Diapherotrites archaeon]
MNPKILIILILLVFTLSVFADEYIDAEKEDPYMGSDNAVNGFYGGQKVDFEISFENIQWTSNACSPDGPVVTGVSLDVVYWWERYPHSWAGRRDWTQLPGSDETDGPDFATVFISGPYILDVLSSDSGTLDGGLQGIKFDNIPEDQEKNTRHLVLKLQPREPYTCCEPVPPLEVVTQYFHSYDGSPQISSGNNLDVSASFPWGVSVGGTIYFSNNYIWHKDAQETITNPEGQTCDNILLGTSDKCICTERQTGYNADSGDSSSSSLCSDIFRSNTTSEVCSLAEQRTACVTQVQSCMNENSQYSDLNPADICSSLGQACAESSTARTAEPSEIEKAKQLFSLTVLPFFKI